MFRKLHRDVRKSVKEAIIELGWDLPDNIPIEEPPRPDMGDVATSVAFELASKLKRSPVKINRELMEVIKKPTIFKEIKIR